MAQDQDVFLSDGLFGLDEKIDQLNEYFEQLQLLSVDAAQPSVDLFSFAQEALLFCGILKKRPQTVAAKPLTRRKVQGGPSVGQHRPYSPGNIFANPYLSASNISGQSSIDLNSHNPWSRITQENNEAMDADNSKENIGEQDAHFYNWQDNSIHPPSYASDNTPPACVNDLIGLVYLVNSTAYEDPLHLREANIGIFIDPKYRGNGYSRQVIQTVLDKAFNSLALHRVQAILPHHVAKDRAICLFTSMRFSHEGTRRRAYWSPFESHYMDVSYLGILDTDWILRDRKARPAPRSVWDELFARHQREREELLNWESKLPEPTLRRTGSMITLRSSSPKLVGATNEYLSDASLSGYNTDASEDRDSSPSHSKGKRRMEDDPGTDGISRPAQQRRLAEPDSDVGSDNESLYSSAPSDRSATPEGYSSAASWYAMDPPSSPSSSSQTDAEWDDFEFDGEEESLHK